MKTTFPLKHSISALAVVFAVAASAAGPAGADVNARDPDGMTALMLAAQAGQRDLAASLLDRGADVNARTPLGITALMLAAEEGRGDIAQLLIAKGADVNARSEKRHMTPLMWAAMSGKRDVAELLVASGADVSARTYKTGFTAADFAYAHGDVEALLKRAQSMPAMAAAR